MTDSIASGMTHGGITIGHAAAFAGVTITPIRHYHQHGLVREPGRDRSGYALQIS